MTRHNQSDAKHYSTPSRILIDRFWLISQLGIKSCARERVVEAAFCYPAQCKAAIWDSITCVHRQTSFTLCTNIYKDTGIREHTKKENNYIASTLRMPVTVCNDGRWGIGYLRTGFGLLVNRLERIGRLREQQQRQLNCACDADPGARAVSLPLHWVAGVLPSSSEFELVAVVARGDANIKVPGFRHLSHACNTGS